MAKPVLVRVDDTIHAAIAKVAADADRSVSDIGVKVLTAWLDQQARPTANLRRPQPQKQTDPDRLLMLLDKVLTESGKTMVNVGAFRARFYQTRADMSPNTNRESFRRSLLTLAARGEIDRRDGLIIRMKGKEGRRSV
jgi:hypothetical protein